MGWQVSCLYAGQGELWDFFRRSNVLWKDPGALRDPMRDHLGKTLADLHGVPR